MIVMINGAFGVGKTATATQLVNRIANAIIFDPEEVGFMLRNIILDALKQENEKTDDFQDLELWRVLVVQVAQQIVQKYKCNLLVPMTLKNKYYFDYLYQGFRNIDQNVFSFCLVASKECIHKRLEERGDAPGSWAYSKTDECIAAFSSYDFGEHIETGSRDINEVVDYIVSRVESLKGVNDATHI